MARMVFDMGWELYPKFGRHSRCFIRVASVLVKSNRLIQLYVEQSFLQGKNDMSQSVVRRHFEKGDSPYVC